MSKRVDRGSPPTNPQGDYRSPYSQPPRTYNYPPQNRSAEIITISLLVAAFLLLGVGGMLWFVQTRMAFFGPTPTPTPTQGPPLTATPDFLATRVAEDFLTQQAYQMALLGTETPTPMDFSTATEQPVEGTPELTNTPVIVRLPGVSVPGAPSPTSTLPPEVAIVPVETPTLNIIVLPIVVDRSPLATHTPTLAPTLAPTLVPTETPTSIPVELPTETPTVTPLLPTETPTATFVPPTIAPTETPIPPGQPFVVASMQGYVQTDGTWLRLGPSNTYTQVFQLPVQTTLTILKRNNSGEWLYVCCAQNRPDVTPSWVRQAFVRPLGNPTPSGAPEGINPNDVRWLAVEPPPAYLPPLPTAVPPGPDDFPLYRYDRHASGRVDQLPNAPFVNGWGTEAGRAGGPLNSPVAVMGLNVLVASADNHLYSFDRFSGSQRWRLDLCQFGCAPVTLTPMTYDNEIFIVDQNRTIWSLNENLSGDNPNSVNILWRRQVAQPALTSLNIYSETLFLATGEGSSHTLLALDRDNGGDRWAKTSTGPGLRYPAIGDQLVYAADGVVTAYDVNNGEQVWQNGNVQNIIAGPVYGSPGIAGLAELFVVGGDNRIYALDANTGVELWNIDNGEAATSLALNENTLFLAGDGYVKAISRQDRSQRWRTALLGGQVMGGPLVDANRLLVATQSGNVYLLDNQSGNTIALPSIAAFAAGSPAVSGPYIFVPGTDGRLYDFLTNQ